MPTYYTIITDAGRQKLIEAALSGLPIQITHMSVGTAMGSTPSPSPAITALVEEVYRAPVNAVGDVPGFPGRVQMDFHVPGEVGGFTIREMGAHLADGTLFSYAVTPPTYKPQEPDGATSFMVARMVIDLESDVGAVLQIQAVSGFASQQWSLDSFRPRFHQTVELGQILEYVLNPQHLFCNLVFNSPEDIFVYLPQQSIVALPQGLAVWMRNRGAGNIWLVPQEDGNAVEGAGNTTVDPKQVIELRLEKAEAVNRWVTIGNAMQFAEVPDLPDPPLINAVVGYDNETLLGYDGQPIEFYEET